MIYLDHSATTKPDLSVVDSFVKVTNTYFANPSSIHKLGAEVEQLQTKAREQAADLLGILPEEVVFTSGGTEGNNLAIKGVAFQHQQRGKHIITTEVEHASVYETCKALERFGFEVTFLPVDPNGVVHVEAIEAAIRPDTILVSIMHVNNEIGAIQPIHEIGQLLKKYPKIFFHVDAVQALGKIPVALHDTNIDLCTFSGHKIHGLQGTGMTFVKKGTLLFPLLHGGNQEASYRSGTENVAGNIAFVRALRLIREKEQTQGATLRGLHKQLLQHFVKMHGVLVNSVADGAPHIVHISVSGLKPEVVIHALFEKGFVISTQSACSSKALDISRVLEACGKPEEAAKSGLRISLSYNTSEKDITEFMAAFDATVTELKGILG